MSWAAYSPSRWQASVWLLESRFWGHKTESALLVTNMGAVCPAPQELCHNTRSNLTAKINLLCPPVIPGSCSLDVAALVIWVAKDACLFRWTDGLPGTTSISRLGWCEVSRLAGSPAPAHTQYPLVPPSCSLPAWAPLSSKASFLHVLLHYSHLPGPTAPPSSRG